MSLCASFLLNISSREWELPVGLLLVLALHPLGKWCHVSDAQKRTDAKMKWKRLLGLVSGDKNFNLNTAASYCVIFLSLGFFIIKMMLLGADKLYRFHQLLNSMTFSIGQDLRVTCCGTVFGQVGNDICF